MVLVHSSNLATKREESTSSERREKMKFPPIHSEGINYWRPARKRLFLGSGTG